MAVDRIPPLTGLVGKVSTNNTSTATLGAGAAFTGTADDMLHQAVAIVTLHTDQDSAADGLEIQFSDDAATWHVTDTFGILAGTIKTFTLQPVMRYFRVKYTNGATPQGHMHLSTQFRSTMVKPSSHRIQDNIVDEDDAELVKAVLTGQAPNGIFANAKLDEFNSQLIGFGDGPHMDAAGRLRMSLPFTVSEHTFDYAVGSQFWDTDTVGGGSGISHVPDASSVLLTAGTGAADSVIRTSFRYFHYRPGKSQYAQATGVMGAAVANVRRRIGYFDVNDGIFLEQNGTTDVAIVKRTSTSGAPVETRVTQANWNIDRFDGSSSDMNPSGVELDLSTGIILHIDLLWYGYGDVAVGFKVGRRIQIAHIFRHTGLLTVPYMKTGSLPLRYEITNTAAQGVAHTMLQTCSQVINEDGGEEPTGVILGADTGTTVHAVTTRRALISIRMKATLGGKINRVIVRGSGAGILVGTNDCLWEILYGSVFTGTPVWVDPFVGSAVEYSIHTDAALGALTTPGIKMHSGHGASGSGASRIALRGDNLQNKAILHLDSAGANPTAISVVGTSMSGTSNIAASIEWQEIQ